MRGRPGAVQEYDDLAEAEQRGDRVSALLEVSQEATQFGRQLGSWEQSRLESLPVQLTLYVLVRPPPEVRVKGLFALKGGVR